jgi:flagellar biosynthesis protein FlhG
MPDQADGLRSLFARRRPSLLIVAGSDRCKAAVAVHFAREAAAEGRVTVLVDGTAGQLAAACEVSCRYELSHVLAGDKQIADVLRTLDPRLLLLPAARALSRSGSFTPEENERLGEAFSSGIAQALANAGIGDAQVDLIVVNADEAKATQAVEAFGRDARVVIVATDQSASLRGAYLEMKLLSQQQKFENFEVVVPRFDDVTAPGVVFTNLANAARRFLDIELEDGRTVHLVEPDRAVFTAARTSLLTEQSDDALDASSATPMTNHLPIDEAQHAAVA